MLITTKNLPMNNAGLPWGTIILAVILIGGVGYMSYQAWQSPSIVRAAKIDDISKG